MDLSQLCYLQEYIIIFENWIVRTHVNKKNLVPWLWTYLHSEKLCKEVHDSSEAL